MSCQTYAVRLLSAIVQSGPVLARRLVTWFRRHARDLPWRRTRDPYAIWVSEIMLQQTQVKTVIPYWERWMTQLPGLKALARAPQARVLKLWEGLGYYSRARNMRRAARLLVRDFDGKFPADFEAVLGLPGIGRYTAGAICSIAFNQPHPVLDGNVIRVLTRLFGITRNPKERRTNERLWRLAGEFVSAARRRTNGCSHLNQALMELGATVCLPKNPRCAHCPVRTECVALRTDRVDRLPNLPRRAKATPRRFMAFVLKDSGRYLVRQRPNGVVNAGLWEFPNVEVDVGRVIDPRTIAGQVLGLRLETVDDLFTVRHTITRYRIALDVFSGRVGAKATPGQWLTLAEINSRALASAHRRIFEKISASQP